MVGIRIFTRYDKAIDMHSLRSVSHVRRNDPEGWTFMLTYINGGQIHVGGFSSKKICKQCREDMILFWQGN